MEFMFEMIAEIIYPFSSVTTWFFGQFLIMFGILFLVCGLGLFILNVIAVAIHWAMSNDARREREKKMQEKGEILVTLRVKCPCGKVLNTECVSKE